MNHRKKFGLRMLVAPTCMLLLVSFYPLFNSLYLSFTNHNVRKRNQNIKFMGLDNYVKFFSDQTVWKALSYSLLYALCSVICSYVIGMLLALLLNRKMKGRALFRGLILIPWAIPTVVATANWLWILNDRSGIINNVLLQLNLIEKPILFFADQNLARITCIVVGIWKSYPFMTMSLLAGLQGVPEELYESGKIDGAGGIKSFFYITLPMIKNVSLVVITLMFIWGFNNFDIIYLLTQGGPLDATFTLPIYTYNTAFYRGQMGYASAISTMTLVILLSFCLVYIKAQTRQGKE